MSKNQREKKTIRLMIGLYCRGHHGTPGDICESCRELLKYAEMKLDRCPFPKKPKCSHCTVHCYDRAHRAAIKEVMRYAGPRMLLKHPIAALMHQLGISE